MPANGFIGFITAQGFFVGLVYAVLRFNDPMALLVITLLVTGIFYMVAQISTSYFVRYIQVRAGNFPKSEYEFLLEQFSDEIKKREDIFEQKSMPSRRVEPVVELRDTSSNETLAEEATQETESNPEKGAL